MLCFTMQATRYSGNAFFGFSGMGYRHARPYPANTARVAHGRRDADIAVAVAVARVRHRLRHVSAGHSTHLRGRFAARAEGRPHRDAGRALRPLRVHAADPACPAPRCLLASPTNSQTAWSRCRSSTLWPITTGWLFSCCAACSPRSCRLRRRSCCRSRPFSPATSITQAFARARGAGTGARRSDDGSRPHQVVAVSGRSTTSRCA